MAWCNCFPLEPTPHFAPDWEAEAVMGDILILTHIDYCPPGHMARGLDAACCDFSVLRVALGELDACDLGRPHVVAVLVVP